MEVSCWWGTRSGGGESIRVNGARSGGGVGGGSSGELKAVAPSRN